MYFQIEQSYEIVGKDGTTTVDKGAMPMLSYKLKPILCVSGMFPYTCLATMPLFCHVDWPRKVQAWFNGSTYVSEYEQKYGKSTETWKKHRKKIPMESLLSKN